VLIGVVATGVVGPESAQGAQKRFVFAKRIAPAGGILSFTVTCPRGWVEVGGTILSNPALMRVRANIPGANARQRIFSFDNRGRSQAAEVRVRITCLRIPPPRVGGPLRLGRPILIKSKFKPKKLARRPRIVSTPICPKRQLVVGPGIEIRPSDDAPAKQQIAAASVRETGIPFSVSKFWISRTKRGERAQVRAEGARLDGYDIRVSARCLKPVATSGPTGHRSSLSATRRVRIKINLPVFSGPVEPGINRVKASCPKGSISLGAGYAFPPGTGLSLFRAFPLAGRASIWEIDSPATTEVLVRVQAQCLDTSSSLRRR